MRGCGASDLTAPNPLPDGDQSYRNLVSLLPIPRSARFSASTLLARRLASCDVDDLLLEQLGQVLVEALAAGFAVADGAFQLFEFAVEDVLPHDAAWPS